MFVRIVKMDFKPENVNAFLAIFKASSPKIRGFKGCSFLELYRDKNNSNIFFTYSYWDNDEALKNYRASTLFKEVWAETKTFFNNKPQAWSVDKLFSLK